ncbi:DMT family transporter [Patescibacteria group bacterium]|nr:DMT family transporter [Patescibacteria group bacterium]
MKNKGILLALCTAVISGVAVFFNKFASAQFGDPYVFTFLKNAPVAILFLAIILMPRFWKQVKALGKKQWFHLLLIGLIGGAIPFLMFFKGLTITSSGNAALIHKTLFIWVGILAVIFLKEKFSRYQLLALPVLFLGSFILTGFNGWNFGVGDALVFGATLFWAVEFVLAKKVLRNLSSEIVAWGRMFFGSVFLVIFLAFTGRGDFISAINYGNIGWLVLSSALLFGYVFTWYKALKHAPASVVSIALVPAFIITVFLNSIFITGVFSLKQLAVSLLFTGGVFIFLKFRRKISYEFAIKPTR